jgi:hypothetical protein
MLSGTHVEHEFLSQIGPGLYEPRNHPWIRREDNFLSKHLGSVMITHCGAGTVYHLLEANVPFIAVPNLERADPHQMELAEFLHQNSYAIVCFKVPDISIIFQKRAWESFSRSTYEKDSFFRAEEIRKKIDGWLI